jgi:methylenetetrahydrofolate reductase (NADPH)
MRSPSLAVTAELAPSPDPAALLERASRLRGFVDAVQVTENPGLRPLGSPLAAAATLLQAGIEPVLHMNCRDRNRIALQGDLLGAASLGISSLLLMRSVPMRTGPTARKHAVFDIGTKELIADARRIRDSETPAAFGLAQSPDFFIGTTVTVFGAVDSWQPRALLRKLDAGAQWMQTQLCLDMPLLRSYMRQFVAARLPHRAYVMVSIAPLLSTEAARRLRANMRAAQIPDQVMRRIEQAADAERTGVEVCGEMLRELADLPGVSGAHIIAPGDPDIVRAVVEASGLRSSTRTPMARS